MRETFNIFTLLYGSILRSESNEHIPFCLQHIMEYLYNGGTWTVHIESHDEILEVSKHQSQDHKHIADRFKKYIFRFLKVNMLLFTWQWRFSVNDKTTMVILISPLVSLFINALLMHCVSIYMCSKYRMEYKVLLINNTYFVHL